jgi:hypothetical protein
MKVCCAFKMHQCVQHGIGKGEQVYVCKTVPIFYKVAQALKYITK